MDQAPHSLARTQRRDYGTQTADRSPVRVFSQGGMYQGGNECPPPPINTFDFGLLPSMTAISS